MPCRFPQRISTGQNTSYSKGYYRCSKNYYKSSMSELSNEIKRRVIAAIKNSAHKSTRMNIKDLDKFVLAAVEEMGNYGDDVHVSQTIIDNVPSVTLTISGLKIPVDAMWRISQDYFERQLRYMDASIIPASHYLGDNPTATGQTRGRMEGKDLDDNMQIHASYFRFRMPKLPRVGDKEKRETSIQANNRKRKAQGKKTIFSTLIQRGPHKGQRYVPPTYSEVAGYIEKRLGKSIFFTDEQEIKKIVVTELVRAME